MQKKTLHLIGNAHIDPVWLWQWQEGFHEVKASFRSALDRMNSFDDFIFVASSAAFYEWVEQSDPEMFVEIQERVAEGRWRIVGGWWVEPDCNIPCGESFVRHSLYGQRYFKEKFGTSAKTGFNIDSFGHAGTLPQILKQAGIEQYVFLRPGPHEMELPGRLFQWQGPDGTQICAFEIPYCYNASGEQLETFLQEHPEEIPERYPVWMVFMGVGNHGGGPTIETIKKVHRMNESEQYPVELRFSTPETFFNAIRNSNIELPIVDTELQHHASGCYSVHSGIKQWNRKAENALIAAEKWSVIGKQLLGVETFDAYSKAWKFLLFNQFHDIMAGTSLEEAYRNARNQIGEAISIAERNQNLAFQAIAWNIQIPQEAETLSIIVFNPLAFPVKTPIEVEVFSPKTQPCVVDENGNECLSQLVQSHAVTWRKRLCFEAELPALGYRTYRLITRHDENEQNLGSLQATSTTLENEFLKVQFDPENGTITSLIDKQSRTELIQSNGAKPVVLNDPGDTWAHGVFSWHDVVGTFNSARLELVEQGPLKATIRVTSRYQASTLIQDFTLTAHSRQLDVKVKVNWQEQLKMLKLQFPTTVQNGTVTAENAYGHCARQPNGIEEPMQRWVDLSNGQHGLSLINDAKYSYDVENNVLSLTVLRSPAYAHHIPTELVEHEQYTYIDQGWQEFQYALIPHIGNWQQADILQIAELLNQPPYALIATYHPNGKLPQADSFIRVDSDSVYVTVLKEAEDGDGIVMRAVEAHGKASAAEIHFPLWNRTIHDAFRPFEIKTYLIPWESEQAIQTVNIVEMATG